jgi:hypothetical protein
MNTSLQFFIFTAACSGRSNEKDFLINRVLHRIILFNYNLKRLRIAEASPDPQISKEQEKQHLHIRILPDITGSDSVLEWTIFLC